MRISYKMFPFFLLLISGRTFAGSLVATVDSSARTFIPPDHSVLGIDMFTGLVLYCVAIIFGIMAIALWRRNINLNG